MFGYTSLFSPWVSNVIALGLTMVLAQITFFRKTVEFFGWVVFSPEATWIRFLIFVGIVAALIFLGKMSTKIGERYKKNKEKMDKILSKVERGFFHKFMDALQNAFKDK